MRHIRSIGKSLCAFSCDYAVKVRHVSPHSDVKVWAHSWDYSRLANRALCRLNRSQTLITAFASQQDFLFLVSPSTLPSFSFFLKQSPLQTVPGLFVIETFGISSATQGSVRVDFSTEHAAPKVKTGFGCRWSWGSIGLFPAFSLGDRGSGVSGSALVSLESRGVNGDYIFQKKMEKITHGLRFASPLIDIGLVIGGMGQLCCEGRFWKNFGVAFQIAELFHKEDALKRAFATSSLGVRYRIGPGYFGANWRAPRTVAWRFKYLFGERLEAGVTAVIHNYEFGKSLFSFSICVYSDDPERVRRRPRVRPPGFWRRNSTTRF
jgi:hypothetical protein